MAWHCPRCGEEAADEHVDAERALLVCPRCGELSEVSDQLALVRPAKAVAAPVPTHYRVKRIPRSEVVGEGVFRAGEVRLRDDLVIEWRWSREQNLAATMLFALAMLACVLVAPALPGVAAAAGFAVSALVAGYLAACALLNATQLSLTGTTLEIGYGPIPWPGRRRFDLSYTRQLVVTSPTEPDRDDPGDPIHTLSAVDGGGVASRILDFNSADDARFVAGAIEQVLRGAGAPAPRALSAGARRGARG